MSQRRVQFAPLPDSPGRPQDGETPHVESRFVRQSTPLFGRVGPPRAQLHSRPAYGVTPHQWDDFRPYSQPSITPIAKLDSLSTALRAIDRREPFAGSDDAINRPVRTDSLRRMHSHELTRSTPYGSTPMARIDRENSLSQKSPDPDASGLLVRSLKKAKDVVSGVILGGWWKPLVEVEHAAPKEASGERWVSTFASPGRSFDTEKGFEPAPFLQPEKFAAPSVSPEQRVSPLEHELSPMVSKLSNEALERTIRELGVGKWDVKPISRAATPALDREETSRFARKRRHVTDDNGEEIVFPVSKVSKEIATESPSGAEKPVRARVLETGYSREKPPRETYKSKFEVAPPVLKCSIADLHRLQSFRKGILGANLRRLMQKQREPLKKWSELDTASRSFAEDVKDMKRFSPSKYGPQLSEAELSELELASDKSPGEQDKGDKANGEIGQLPSKPKGGLFTTVPEEKVGELSTAETTGEDVKGNNGNGSSVSKSKLFATSMIAPLTPRPAEDSLPNAVPAVTATVELKPASQVPPPGPPATAVPWWLANKDKPSLVATDDDEGAFADNAADDDHKEMEVLGGLSKTESPKAPLFGSFQSKDGSSVSFLTQQGASNGGGPEITKVEHLPFFGFATDKSGSSSLLTGETKKLEATDEAPPVQSEEKQQGQTVPLFADKTETSPSMGLFEPKVPEATSIFGAASTKLEGTSLVGGYKKPEFGSLFGTDLTKPQPSAFLGGISTLTPSAPFTSSPSQVSNDPQKKDPAGIEPPSNATASLFGTNSATRTPGTLFGKPNDANVKPGDGSLFANSFGIAPAPSDTAKPTSQLFGDVRGAPSLSGISNTIKSSETGATMGLLQKPDNGEKAPVRPPVGSLFGNLANTDAPVSPAIAAVSEPMPASPQFGSTQNPTPLTGLFSGLPSEPVGGSLFSASQQSLFGATSTVPTGLVRQPEKPASSLFGPGTGAATFTSGSAAPPSQPLFGGTGSLFGGVGGDRPTSSSQPSPLFGQAPASQPTGSLFGILSQGQSQSTLAHDGAASLFGAAPPQSTSIFGMTPAPSATSMFAASDSSSNPFTSGVSRGRGRGLRIKRTR